MTAGLLLQTKAAWDADDGEDRMEGARLLRTFMIVTPILWVLGLLLPASAALIGRLSIKRWPVDGWTNLIVAFWTLTALAQAIATIYTWSLIEEPLSFLIGKFAGFPILGWLMLGLCIAAGSAWHLSQPAVVRGTAVLGLNVLICGIIGLAGAFLTRWAECVIHTPFYALLGQGPTAEFYATAVLWHPEEGSFGFPRLVMFYPWATCLGIAGVSITLISLCETHARWRAIGIAGGLFAIVFSFSRAAVSILPLALAYYALLQMRGRTIVALAVVASIIAIAIVTFGLDPSATINDILASLRESRAGSSQARSLIYERSFEAFLASPIFGNGWVGDSIIRQEVIPIGSHSTLFGVLYMGGITTFACLCLATLLLLLGTTVAAVRSGTKEAAAAAGVTLAFVLFGYGEGIYNLVLPCCFVFLFIGGALRPQGDRRLGSIA